MQIAMGHGVLTFQPDAAGNAGLGLAVEAGSRALLQSHDPGPGAARSLVLPRQLPQPRPQLPRRSGNPLLRLTYDFGPNEQKMSEYLVGVGEKIATAMSPSKHAVYGLPSTSTPERDTASSIKWVARSPATIRATAWLTSTCRAGMCRTSSWSAPAPSRRSRRSTRRDCGCAGLFRGGRNQDPLSEKAGTPSPSRAPDLGRLDTTRLHMLEERAGAVAARASSKSRKPNSSARSACPTRRSGTKQCDYLVPPGAGSCSRLPQPGAVWTSCSTSTRSRAGTTIQNLIGVSKGLGPGQAITTPAAASVSISASA